VLPDPCNRGRHWRAVCCASLFLLVTPASHASDDCHLPEFASPVINETLLQTVLGHETRCSKDADWQFWIGQALNTLHRYPEAAERLESALMIAPGHWQARIEYLVALEGSGEIPSARALIDDLIHDPQIPETLRQALASRPLPDLPLWREQGKTTYSSLTLSLGHDSNLLGNPSARTLNLTLPEGQVPANLTRDSRPKSGALTRIDYRHQQQWPSEESGRLWHALFTSNLRYAPSETRADYIAYEARLENAAYERGPYIQGHLLGATNRSGEFYRQGGLEAGWESARIDPICRLRLGGEYQHRQYPVADELNGQYTGLMLRNVCVSPGKKMELRIGQDHAERSQRPGGDRQRIQLAFGQAINWQNARLYLDVEYEHIRDLDGYSPLLGNNLKRNINRQLYRIEFNKSLSTMEIIGGIEFAKQHSNLALFTTESRTLYIGLRHLW
jgi:hypothetical protein